MKSAKRLLNDLDSHLLCSKENQKILLRQLGSENNDVQPEPPRDQAEVRVEQNNEAEQQPPEILPQNPEVPPPQNPVVPLPQNPVVPDPNNQNQGQDDLVENVNVITTADVPQQITHETVSVASHNEKPAEPTPVIKEDNKQDIAVAKVPAVPEHLPDQKVIYTEVYYPKGAFFQKDPNQCSKELMLKNILTTFLAESKQAESKNGFGERTVESDEQQQQIRTIPVC